MMLEDRAGLGPDALVKAANALVAAANKDPDFAGVFSLFNAKSPSVYADIDRVKAQKVGLKPTDVFSTLQVYLGSQYVNDFNYLGRTYQVVVQADGQFRRTSQDIFRLKARNTSGEMVPVGTVAQMQEKTIPYRVPRYNLYPQPRCRGSRRRKSQPARRCTGWKNSPTKFFRPASDSNGPTSRSSNSNAARRRFSSSAPPLSVSSWCSPGNMRAGNCRSQ